MSQTSQLLVLGVLGLVAFAGGSKKRVSEVDVRDGVFFAVLEGLYVDGVDTASVDRILMQDKKGNYMHFVPACPLCMPAFNAFRIYRDRVKFHGWKDVTDTFGRGLSDHEFKRLRSAVPKERLDVVNGLVDRWVRRRIESLNLDDEAKGAWALALARARKRGMDTMSRVDGYVGEKRCAVCDGANAVFDAK